MQRRTFLKTSAALPLLHISNLHAEIPTHKSAIFSPHPDNGWRTFSVRTAVKLAATESGKAQVWLPLPSVNAESWSNPLEDQWHGNAASIEKITDPKYGMSLLHAVWDGSQKGAPELGVVSRVSLRDRAVDFNNPVGAPNLSIDERSLYTSASEHMPIDGIVQETARKITKGYSSDEEKARAIYDWIVDNTVRDPKTHACGLGDIKWMLETGNLKGKCADLNTLFVGLARAVGLPARDVYGIRVAPSAFGYSSLGSSGDISKSQHCRAEVFLTGHGWVSVDPADVRKVMLEEEKPNILEMDNPKVQAVRHALFGSWESNWLPYNVAHDVELPGSAGEKAHFLMYPHGELEDGTRLDGTRPDQFEYTIVSNELTIGSSVFS